MRRRGLHCLRFFVSEFCFNMYGTCLLSCCTCRGCRSFRPGRRFLCTAVCLFDSIRPCVSPIRPFSARSLCLLSLLSSRLCCVCVCVCCLACLCLPHTALWTAQAWFFFARQTRRWLRWAGSRRGAEELLRAPSQVVFLCLPCPLLSPLSSPSLLLPPLLRLLGLRSSLAVSCVVHGV